MHRSLMLPVLCLLSLPALGQQEHQFRIGAAGGAAFPIRDFGDIFSIGYGGQVSLLYETSPGIQIALSAGGLLWNADNAGINQSLMESGSTATANVDAPLTIYPVTVGGRILWPGETARPYAGVSLGMYFTNLEVSGTLTDGQATQTLSESSSFSTFALDLELGVLIPLGDKVDVNLQGKYNAVSDTEAVVIPPAIAQDPVTARSLRYLSLMLGLEYSL